MLEPLDVSIEDLRISKKQDTPEPTKKRQSSKQTGKAKNLTKPEVAALSDMCRFVTKDESTAIHRRTTKKFSDMLPAKFEALIEFTDCCNVITPELPKPPAVDPMRKIKIPKVVALPPVTPPTNFTFTFTPGCMDKVEKATPEQTATRRIRARATAARRPKRASEAFAPGPITVSQIVPSRPGEAVKAKAKAHPVRAGDIFCPGNSNISFHGKPEVKAKAKTATESQPPANTEKKLVSPHLVKEPRSVGEEKTKVTQPPPVLKIQYSDKPVLPLEKGLKNLSLEKGTKVLQLVPIQATQKKGSPVKKDEKKPIGLVPAPTVANPVAPLNKAVPAGPRVFTYRKAKYRETQITLGKRNKQEALCISDEFPDPLYKTPDIIPAKTDSRFREITMKMRMLTLSDRTDFSAATTAPATGNPFGAAPVNPFLAKTAPAAATAPENPFQATSKLANPSPFAAASTPSTFGAPSAQPAAPIASSPFSAFGRPTPLEAPATQQQTPAATAQPQQSAFSSAFQTSQPAASGPSSNPFASLHQATPASTSAFGAAPAFGAAGNTATGFQSTPESAGFGQPATFGAPAASTLSAAANPFLATAKLASSTPSPSPSPFSATPTTAAAPAPVATGFGALTGAATKPAAAKKSVHFNLDPVASQQAAQGFGGQDFGAGKPGSTNGFSKLKPATTTSVKPPASGPKDPQSDYAKKIVAQLQKDRLKPPQWPADPGNPANASAMEAFWISYGNYRDKVRASLVKAGLIDDPKVRKRLDEAIDFKGICEEMCPEYEKIERIFQHNVMMSEKTESPDGTMWPSPPLMVKALTRSSAGQEAPLPMDVRTVAALKRTLDHLIDDVLGDDSRLPSVHNFLWDRTRAIRRDFIFHSNMSEEEMLQQIYCFETITRFHATSLHLLSQKGFAPEGFDQRQEREQLSKALLSLLQAYDDCKDRQITCTNECEFRAYFILLNAHDPNFQHKVSEWGMQLWYDSDDVQTAMTLAQSMQSVWDWRGPIKPTAPTTTALGAFATFFRIVESPQVSYTMACLAEMHFVHVRRGILRNMTRAYARARDSPKDLTIAALNSMLRFDTIDEAWDFVIANKLEFSSEDKATAHLVLDKSVQISSMPIPQLFSQNLVERKRAGRSLPEALHRTVYEDAKYTPTQTTTTAPAAKQASDMFVSQSQSPAAPLVKSPTAFPTQASTSVLSGTQPTTSTPSFFTTTPASSTPASTTPSLLGAKPTTSTTTPAASSSVFSELISGADKKDAPPSLFPTTPSTTEVKDKAQGTVSTSVFASPTSTTPPFSPSKSSDLSNLLGLGTTKTPSVFDTKPPATTTAAPATSILSQAGGVTNTTAPTPAASVLFQPAAGSSFSSLFPTSAPPAKETKTNTPPAASTNPLLDAVSAAKTTEPKKSVPDSAKSASSLGEVAKTPAAASSFAPSAPSTQTASSQPFSAPKSQPPPPPPAKTDLMGDFAKWFVKGDNGILSEFQEAFVDHLVRGTFEQFQRNEQERIQREEDEKSWAEALRFKTYNLRVKFFYKWRRIARERALDRRARQARDELKAYRTAKRAEQRAAAEKAAADERKREAEARRMGSKEVKFLEELGYYGEFGVSRKRKATVADDNEQQRASSVSMSVVEQQQQQTHGDEAAMQEAHNASGMLRSMRDEHSNIARVGQEVTQQQQPPPQQPEPQRNPKLPVRSIKEGISNTVSRAKELLSSRISSSGITSNKRHRDSIGSFDDAASISGDSMHSIRSTRSIRSSFSPDGSQVAYYRRSIPGKSRAKSFFTRIPSGTTPTTATAEGDSLTPKKVTNFMRYSKKASDYGFGGAGSSVSGSVSVAGGVSANHNNADKRHNRWSSPGVRQRPATATASPSPSSLASFSNSVAGSGVGSGAPGGGSKVRSSYWRLRAMGMVQMPNKQYLHESLALPMLQDGKRFPGVGNYGLPPVPAWNDETTDGKKTQEGEIDDFSINKDGGVEVDADEDEDEQARAQRYTEERLRRTAMPPSRKRLFSGGGSGQDGAIGATASYARVPRVATAAAAAASSSASVLTSPPDAKKARLSVSPNNAGEAANSSLSEAERVIREMREMADAMDQGRDWFREQTELMKSGTSAWDE
ncbi:actin cytoskeleton and mitosis protein [Sporothrix eucalyptigena]|uniref:Actin cytoskeleton and mitosis protein n=1 Tax=Sporothrix eucalyptigena TaxID=1812306 RepID=A0ABP0C8V7_9PEZI